jgi:DNA invertase Pin-like site-specific DNA recombinase
MTNALVLRNNQLPKSQRSLRAAQYVRMSTDYQRYSIENQAATIAAYAASHNLTIVRTYADEGRSGLRIANRDALVQLINDVTAGRASFDHLLVYDVSRWGRFPDIDESAHYEFVCRQAGINVVYCAEQFDNDGGLVSSIVKNIKRVMAAEYSRELSVKVHTGACRLARMGFRQGGRPCFGLRRELRDQSGHSKGALENGQRKSLTTDRVILRPGPPAELEVVRDIFRQFVSERKPQTKIARQLNARGIRDSDGKPWTEWKIHYVLKNENYIGNSLYNRTSCKLRKRQKPNSPDLWIRMENALEPIVEPAVFNQAQRILKNHYLHLSNEDILKRLRVTLKDQGKLSRPIIDKALGTPSATLYQLRFGSLRNAYRLIGYIAKRNCNDIDSRRERAEVAAALAARVITEIERIGGRAKFDADRCALSINETFNISFRIARCWRAPDQSPIWTIQRRVYLPDGWILAVRLDESNRHITDCFLLPTYEMIGQRIRFSERSRARYASYRFESVEAAIRSILKRIRAGHTNFASKGRGKRSGGRANVRKGQSKR